MSHFGIFVIGGNVEQQLAPFHEFECTGENDQYVQDVDVTAECQEQGLDWYGLDEKTVTDESKVDREGEHKFGYAIVDADGKLIKAVNRTNPNKKWDWWVIGGRWSGYLKLKSGRYADSAHKVEIDFEAMRNEAGSKASAEWERARAALIAAGAPMTWDTWEALRDVTHKGNIDAAREAYHAQSSVKAIREAFKEEFFLDADQYLVPHEVFTQRARDSATTLYAVVKDSKWVAKGDMGWWGMSNDKVTQDDWNKQFNEMLDALPEDTMITVVDCHI